MTDNNDEAKRTRLTTESSQELVNLLSRVMCKDHDGKAVYQKGWDDQRVTNTLNESGAVDQRVTYHHTRYARNQIYGSHVDTALTRGKGPKLKTMEQVAPLQPAPLPLFPTQPVPEAGKLWGTIGGLSSKIKRLEDRIEFLERELGVKP